MKPKLITFLFLVFLIFNSYAQNKKANYSFIAKNLEWNGVAIEDENYSIWGCAPIQSEDGKTHLFVARWPEKNIDPAWRKSSEIAHYVADKPEGPFLFSDVAIKGTGKDGRVTKEDAVKAMPSMGTAPAYGERNTDRKKLSMLRRKVAQRLVAVKNNTAMLTTFNEVNMQPIFDLRKDFKEDFKEDT